MFRVVHIAMVYHLTIVYAWSGDIPYGIDVGSKSRVVRPGTLEHKSEYLYCKSKLLWL